MQRITRTGLESRVVASNLWGNKDSIPWRMLGFIPCMQKWSNESGFNSSHAARHFLSLIPKVLIFSPALCLQSEDKILLALRWKERAINSKSSSGFLTLSTLYNIKISLLIYKMDRTIPDFDEPWQKL
jgi:hypothetical protein